MLSARSGVRVPLPGREDIDASMHCVLVPLRPGFDELLHLSAALVCSKPGVNLDDPWRHHACPSLGGWLLSSSPAEVVALHLSRCMNQRDGAGQKRYLRWADARVLTALWPGLDAEQRRLLMGPIKTWWAISWQSELLKCTAAQGANATASAITSQPHSAPRLTIEQWTRVGRMAASHLALQQWLSTPPIERMADKSPLDSGSALKVIDAAVARAQAIGFVERDDQIAFALASIQGFDQGENATRFSTATKQALSDNRPLDYCFTDVGLPRP